VVSRNDNVERADVSHSLAKGVASGEGRHSGEDSLRRRGCGGGRVESSDAA
jgi:hypothetical protein